MSQTTIPPPGPSAPGLFGLLESHANRAKLGYALLGAALGLLVLFGVLLAQLGWTDVPVRLYVILMALLLSFVGAWTLLDTGVSGMKPADSLRMQLLTLGGGVGFLTAMLGLGMALFMYAGVFAGGLAVWRQNALRVFLCLVLFLGGLSLMFVTLQLGRSIERSNRAVRRLLYGFNAVLTGLLLLTVLGLLNVLCYVPWGPFRLMNSKWDWTASRIYSLSPATKNFLANLEKPVKVYVLINLSEPAGQDTETLLANCRAVTNKLSWESFSRDLNRKRLQELEAKYQLPDSFGLLVVYGSEGSEQTEFIRLDELKQDNFSRDRQGGTKRRDYIFKGEAALMKALTYLAEDKKKAVVYFTQGNGEPSLAGDFGGGRFAQSVRELRDRLTSANYEVKELELKPGVDKVPADADVVVCANPRLGLPESAVKALTSYMTPTGTARKGKMIVLQDVVLTSDRSKMASTGLEPLLRQFNVSVGQERILAPKDNPTELLIIPNIRSRNPIVQGFFSGGQVSLFQFDDARTVEPGAPETPGARSPYKVESLLITLPRLPVWKESNFSDPVALVDNYLTPQREDELRKKISPQPLSVAVTVSESDPTVPRDMAHANVPGKDEVPRMVVFGDASWITDQALSSRLGKLNGDLFASCLAWLRGRSNIGKDVEDTSKSRQEFTLAGNVTPDRVTLMRFLPMILMLLGIVGLGGGIWLIRRR
jgi:hypothetical protein